MFPRFETFHRGDISYSRNAPVIAKDAVKRYRTARKTLLTNALGGRQYGGRSRLRGAPFLIGHQHRSRDGDR